MRAPVLIGLQAAVWIALTVTFAALIEIAGLAPWSEALIFSATSWLPWAVLAPVVFWLARRFPFERGKLLRAIPVHGIGVTACCFAMLWIGAYFAPWPRGFRPGESRPGGWERRDGGARSEAGGVARDWRERGSDGKTAERAERSSPERGPEATPPADGVRPPGPEPRPERGTFDRRTKSGGMYRGPGSSGGPGSGSRSFMARFWPPFSGLVLRANVSAAVYLIIACFAHAFAYYRRAQDREKEAIALTAGLNRAKLDALRLQLQPHFLFNTLNAISTLVHRDANAADELIGDLSELLRLSLQTSEHEVPLSRELELLDCYLAIEQARLGDRLRIVREIDPQALSALVPTFVLQPLAENAIRHGIEPRMAPGTLTLRAEVVHGQVRLSVWDDGVGLKNGLSREAHRGIGIANTEQRLRALHGDAAHLELLAPETGGVQVQIVLPLRTTPSALSAAGAPA